MSNAANAKSSGKSPEKSPEHRRWSFSLGLSAMWRKLSFKLVLDFWRAGRNAK